MLSKLSYLNSNIALTLGYLNPALNNSAQVANFNPLKLCLGQSMSILVNYIALEKNLKLT